MRCGGSGKSSLLRKKEKEQNRAKSYDRDISKTISPEERDEYWRRSEIYRKWLLERVFDSESKTSVTIMVFPIEVGKPNYREAEVP